jgi:D-alanyl-lipoteichoic acid acyltransferase DltB (MBOAT superfamily)
MIFNSIPFLIFFILFFTLYWFIFNKNLKSQNLLILIGSYVFYGWFDWRFLGFLIAVSALNYNLGITIGKTENLKYKRLLLSVGLIQGIGGLVFFKYFNFFVASFNNVFRSLSINLDLHTINIIIPLGISFFTFRTIGYLLDTYREKIIPTSDWVIFFTYVSFFPTILSGPIDKVGTFIPQLEKKRVFDYDQATDGLRQILWGLFKKIVIADNCAIITNQVFANYKGLPASSLLLAAFFNTIQLYADFSGYSDMAIGISHLIGINVSRNFDFPLFSQNIAEFWRKWHISLTSWLTEYVFIPLNVFLRYYGKFGKIIAIIINFTICGMWHGANWTYILWGFLNGCYFIPIILKGSMNKNKELIKGKIFPILKELANMLRTFTLVMITFILFRTETIGQAYYFFKGFFSLTLFSKPIATIYDFGGEYEFLTFLIFIFIMFVIEWIGREQQYAIALFGQKWYKPVRWAMYYGLILAIYFYAGSKQQFIYFQF